jgi:hypothetical protein
MSQGILPRACFILVLSVILSACGGGDGGTTFGGSEDDDTPVVTPILPGGRARVTVLAVQVGGAPLV